MPKSRKELLIKTAVDLFYRHGYCATGIEKILSTAGVSKPTLYRHFDSKQDLIIAALQSWDQENRTWLTDQVERRGGSPRERLLAIFDAYGDWFAEDGFQGCMFTNATVEFPDQDNPINEAAMAHKHFVARFMEDLLHEAGASEAKDLIAKLMILIEGAIVMAQLTDPKDAARHARSMAAMLLDQPMKTQTRAA